MKDGYLKEALAVVLVCALAGAVIFIGFLFSGNL